MTRTPDMRERARVLHAQAVPLWQIARRLGVSQRTVASWLRRPPMFVPRVCRLCGTTFTPTNGRQRYCSPAHRDEHRRGRLAVRECRLCGEAFMPTNGRQRFCTPAHCKQYQRRYGPPQSVAGWRDRVRALEAEIARVCAELEGREVA